MRIKQGNLWIKGAAQAPAEHFKTDTLPRLDAEPVVVGNLRIGLADDDTGHGHVLGRGARTIAVHLDDLRQVVDTEETKIRHAARGGQAQRVKPKRRILGNVNMNAQLAGVLPIVLVRRNGEVCWEAGPQSGRLGQVRAGQGQLHAGAALHAERDRHVKDRRLRIGRRNGRR